MALNRSTVKCIVTPFHPPAKGLGKRKDKAVQASDVKVFQILLFSLWTRGLLCLLVLTKRAGFTGGCLKSGFVQNGATDEGLEVAVGEVSLSAIACSLQAFTSSKQILLLVLDVP